MTDYVELIIVLCGMEVQLSTHYLLKWASFLYCNSVNFALNLVTILYKSVFDILVCLFLHQIYSVLINQIYFY